MKVKLRIPAVSDHGTHDVGDEVDFADPNQALALIRAHQADAIDDLPFPETPKERAAREDRDRAEADRRRAEGAPLPTIPVTGHTPVPSRPAAQATAQAKDANAPEEKPGAVKPAPTHAQAPNASAKP